jgi:drug/metabolite transporter (DMT)-like permease
MQIPSFVVAILLAVGAILIAVFSSIYDEKKDKKLIAGIVIGVLVYVAGLGLAGMNSPVGAGALAIGSILVSICSYFYNKTICDDDASPSKKRGLVAGIIIGVSCIIFGILWATPRDTIEKLAHNINVGKQETSRLASEAASKIASTAQAAVEPTAPDF